MTAGGFHMLSRYPRLAVLVCLTFLLPLSAMENKPSPYPPSRKQDLTEKIHGVEVSDPYRWLEDATSAEVKDWTEKQNTYTKSVLDKLPGRQKIHDRLEALLDIGTVSAPAPVKGRYFYIRREGKQNQPILYVREGVNGADRVLLDPNGLSKDGTVALDWWYPSRDGKLLAYGLSKDGTEKSTLHVREVATGKDLPDAIDRTRACAVAWLPDSTGFYYTRYPAPGSVPEDEETYHRRVYFHTLGSDPAKDPEVFGKGRAKEDWPDVRLSPDGRWLVVSVSQGWSKTEVYFADRNKVATTFVPLVEKVEALFEVTPRADRFYVHTNDGAPRYRLFQIDPLKPARAEWKEIVPEHKDRTLEGIAAVGDSLVLQYLEKAQSQLEIADRAGKPVRSVKLPGPCSVTGLGAEWDGDELFYDFQSFTIPPTVNRCNLKTGADERWAQVKTDLRLDDYESSQVTYRSKDGTPITMFLSHKKGVKPDGKNPTLLTGYGGFNVSETPSFARSRFLFLEAGGVVAIPNLRGGGEYGEEWHKAGMLGKKQNVFDDFIAAAEWLIAAKWTNRDKLAIQGGSNGGLLMGAVLTQRPDLFRCVICQVPLLDMVRYHKFLIAKLWIPEYGSADDPEQFKWLYAYSPYHRVKPGTAYPAVLLDTAESDTRVDALHARKMTALLQAATSSDRPILLRLETKAGHGAGKPRSKMVEELTDVYSFLFWQLGVTVPPA
jgi:prolyl oligopeptidase